MVDLNRRLTFASFQARYIRSPISGMTCHADLAEALLLSWRKEFLVLLLPIDWGFLQKFLQRQVGAVVPPTRAART
jgi:hypothetical protein